METPVDVVFRSGSIEAIHAWMAAANTAQLEEAYAINLQHEGWNKLIREHLLLRYMRKTHVSSGASADEAQKSDFRNPGWWVATVIGIVGMFAGSLIERWRSDPPTQQSLSPAPNQLAAPAVQTPSPTAVPFPSPASQPTPPTPAPTGSGATP